MPNPNSRTAEVVVEYFDALLGPNRNVRLFNPEAVEEHSPLTVRNRFVLWHSLWIIASDLDFTLGGEGADLEQSMVVEDMPRITRNQTRGWWRAMEESANALSTAARTGDLERLVPRTPAEEALIYLATTSGYIDAAKDQINDNDYADQFDALPQAEDDGDWGEILLDLTGDADIEMLWVSSLDGIESMDSAANQNIGIGDYRAEVWHVPFDGRK